MSVLRTRLARIRGGAESGSMEIGEIKKPELRRNTVSPNLRNIWKLIFKVSLTYVR